MNESNYIVYKVVDGKVVEELPPSSTVPYDNLFAWRKLDRCKRDIFLLASRTALGMDDGWWRISNQDTTGHNGAWSDAWSKVTKTSRLPALLQLKAILMG